MGRIAQRKPGIALRREIYDLIKDYTRKNSVFQIFDILQYIFKQIGMRQLNTDLLGNIYGGNDIAAEALIMIGILLKRKYIIFYNFKNHVKFTLGIRLPRSLPSA